jgi:hypothetical protein
LHISPLTSGGFVFETEDEQLVNIGTGATAFTDPVMGIKTGMQLAELLVVGVAGQPVTPVAEL